MHINIFIHNYEFGGGMNWKGSVNHHLKYSLPDSFTQPMCLLHIEAHVYLCVHCNNNKVLIRKQSGRHHSINLDSRETTRLIKTL